MSFGFWKLSFNANQSESNNRMEIFDTITLVPEIKEIILKREVRLKWNMNESIRLVDITTIFKWMNWHGENVNVRRKQTRENFTVNIHEWVDRELEICNWWIRGEWWEK